jgi:hypothetical protein
MTTSPVAFRPLGLCTICQEDLTPADSRQMICTHLFHQACIGQWLENHDTCPLCRVVFLIEADLPTLPVWRIDRLWHQIFFSPHRRTQMAQVLHSLPHRSPYDQRRILTEAFDVAIQSDPQSIPIFLNRLKWILHLRQFNALLTRALQNAIVQRQRDSLVHLFLGTANLRSEHRSQLIRALRRVFSDEDVKIFLVNDVLPGLRRCTHPPKMRRKAIGLLLKSTA